MENKNTTRRTFMKKSALLTAGMLAVPLVSSACNSVIASEQEEDNIYLIGPQKGYTPMVGTLLSTMTMMRAWVVRQVEGLSVEELDFQIDDDSNSIGAMLWHLAATEKYYQLNTFDGMLWGSWGQEVKDEWDVASGLGKKGRELIKGNPIEFYLEKLSSVRAITQAEFAKRDDDWLQESEPFFGNQPTNNHCKWFHVCEHESNHNGQIKFIKKRFPA